MTVGQEINGTPLPERWRAAIADVVTKLLDGELKGRRATAAMLASVLIYAATTRTSLYAASASLSVADDNTLRAHLNRLASGDNVEELVRGINAQLLADLPAGLLSQRQEVSIDLHDMPYYGKHADMAPWVCRSQARAGTTRFVRIATIHVLRPGPRVTLAMVAVRPGMLNAAVITALVHPVRRARVRLSRIWLDRGFASVDVVQRLQDLRLSAVIAWPIRGKTGGTRALCKGTKTHQITHILGTDSGRFVPVQMAVVRGFGRRHDRKGKARWFLYAIVGRSLDPASAHRLYRFRFGIEASYRALNRHRPRTSSRNIAVRVLLIAITLFIINAWTRAAALIPKRKPRLRARARPLRLQRFADVLRHAIEALLGVRDLPELPFAGYPVGNY
ncbi:MAG: transposase [Ardenticatenales bacterium]|nr:transposase [Ardenticatenales bacterium]